MLNVVVTVGVLAIGATTVSPAGNEAENVFRTARILSSQGEHAAACPLYERSYRLQATLAAMLNLADCFEKTGRIVEAWQRFTQAAEWATKEGDTTRAAFAVKRSAALRSQLGFVVLRYPDTAGRAAFIDDERIERAGVTEAVTIGRHTARLREGEVDLAEKTFEIVRPGDSLEVELVVAPSTVANTGPGTTQVTTDSASTDVPGRVAVLDVDTTAAPKGISPAMDVSATKDTVGKATTTAGAALLVLAGSGLLYSYLKYGDYAANYPRYSAGDTRALSRLYTASWIGAGVGLATLAAGIAVWKWPTEKRVVSLSASPNQLLVSGEF